MNKMLKLAMCCCSLILLPVLAQAHEFIVKPQKMTLQHAEKVPFEVVSAHVFMESEEMEPADQVSMKLYAADKVTPVAVTPDEAAMTLDGAVEIPAKGAAILAGHRNGMIWTQTTKGWKQASKKGLSGVIKSGKYEKFCKAVICNGNAKGFDRAIGQRLEIVPMDDPASLKVGDELRVKVLFDGKPVSSGQLLATYDGFSSQPNTYAYMTESFDDDVARIKVSSPGVWMVRAQQAINEATEDYDSHVMRSVLVFEVK